MKRNFSCTVIALICISFCFSGSCKKEEQSEKSSEIVSYDYMEKDIESLFLNIPHKAIDDSFIELNNVLSRNGRVVDLKRSDVINGDIKKLSKDISVVIDKKNYYINIKLETEDSLTFNYGGYNRTYVVYFLPDKTPVFAISQLDMVKTKQLSALVILKPEKNEWKDVTMDIFPVHSVKDFWEEGRSSDNSPDIKELILDYSLPRSGTKITVTLAGDYQGDTWEQVAHEFRWIKYYQIEVDWKKETGKFEIIRMIDVSR